MWTWWFDLIEQKTSNQGANMSTSLLYHAFGVRGYEYVRTMYMGGTTAFRIEQPREKLRCPQCGSADVTRKGENPRTFVGVPTGGRRTEIVLDVARVHCAACRITRQVEVGFADPHKQHTRQLVRYALKLAWLMTI